MTSDKEKIELYIKERSATGDGDEFDVEAEEAKIKCILAAAAGTYECDMAKEVEAFAARDEESIRKLCLCNLGIDPNSTCAEKEIVPQRFMSVSDLERLHAFVKKHKFDKTFGEAVYEIMAKHGMEAPEVYKNAQLSRQDFSRVTSPSCSGVKKTTVWSIIIGLHCDLVEADYLLYSAGFIRRNTCFDIILEYFIMHKNYDIFAINDALNDCKQKTLSISYSSVKDNDVSDD